MIALTLMTLCLFHSCSAINTQHRFEADSRIKFHIESVTKRLNAEWEARMEELRAHCAKEKQSLIKFYENGGSEGGRVEKNEWQRFKFNDYSSIDSSRVHGFDHHAALNGDKQTEEMIKVPTREMRSDANDGEFSLSSSTSSTAMHQHEQMMEDEKTRHVNSECSRMENMKNECLRALDLQRELMECRHITEILHMMAIIRQHDRAHQSDASELKNGSVEQTTNFHAVKNGNVQPSHHHRHQSKSINSNDVDQKEVHAVKINSDDEANGESEPQRRSIDYGGEGGGGSTDPKVNNKQKLFQQKSNSIDSDESESSKQSLIRNSFVDCVLNRFVTHHTSPSWPLTMAPFSSQRENDYEKKSNPPPQMRTMRGGEMLFIDPSTADVDGIILPKAVSGAAVSRMKDSLEISEQRTMLTEESTQRDGVR